MTENILIYWTCEDVEEAREMVKSLLKERLIACANIIADIESLYIWMGKIEHTDEVKVIMKTVKDNFGDVRDYIIEHAQYDIPEVLQIDVQDGNPDYLKWVSETVEI